MAHKKGQGSSRNGRESESKRLGVKLFGGEFAIPGNIIVRQRGTKFHPGLGVGIGKDHTIFAKEAGVVNFTVKRGNRRYISVLPIDEKTVTKELKDKKTAKKEVEKPLTASKLKVKKESSKEVLEDSKTKEIPKKAASTKKPKKGDDLKKIDGVGPAFEKRLNALGIFTYADLVNLTETKIEELEQQDSMTSLEEWKNWMKQAKNLASK